MGWREGIQILDHTHYPWFLSPFQPKPEVPKFHVSSPHFIIKDIEPQIKNLWRKGTHPGLCGGLVAWPWLESTSPHSQLGVLIKFLVTNLGNIQLTRSNREAVRYGGRGGFLKLISSRHRFPMSTSFVCLFFFHYRNNTHSLKELLNLQRCRKKRENIIILPVIYTTINIWMWGFCF